MTDTGPETDTDARRLETFIDLLPGGVYRCLADDDWTILSMSEGCRAITGYDAQEFLDNTFATYDGIIHEDDRAHVTETVMTGLDEARKFHVSYRIIARDGSVRHISDYGVQAGVHTDGTPIIEGIMLNVSAEIQTLTDLQESETRLREAARISKLGHWHYDEVADRITYCSEELARIHGVSIDEYLAQVSSTEGDVARAHPDDRNYLESVIRSAQREASAYDVEYRIVRADGEVKYLREIGEPIVDASGRLIASKGVVQDITDLKTALHQLEQARIEAERANAAKSEFLAVMSHELRTPLNAVIGFSTMIEGETFGPIGAESYLDYAGHIRQSGEHLLQIVNDVLDLSKIESGEFDLDPVTFALRPIVGEVVGMFGFRTSRSTDSVRMNLASPDLTVYADPRSFRQIVINLLSNADKYTPAYGHIMVSAAPDADGWTVMKISDEGVGIAPDDLQKVIEPFGQARTDIRVTHEGTGLGLSISKLLMEMHGGSLEIESEVGTGTTVRLRFPPAP